MNKYTDIVKAFRSATSWLCCLALAWYMVLQPESIHVATVAVWLVFFVFSFGSVTGRVEGEKDEESE